MPLLHRGVLSCALVAALSVTWFGPARGEASEHDSSYTHALESITVENLEDHVDFLADDAREGREAGGRGGRAAADYLAEQFARFGLEAAGEDEFFQDFPYRYRNVLAVLPGSDPKLRFEIILIGAHYDHVGRGSPRNSRGRVGEIHNGADDNASGTSGLLELAEAFSLLPQRPRRTILFVAWDAEEKGMLGSKHWARHPTVPLDNVVMVFNLDMIGRMRDNTVYVHGTRSSFGLRRLLARHNPGFDLAFPWKTEPNADHWPLFDKEIPYLLLHTGKHAEYHTQNDDPDLINHEGMRGLMRFLFAMVNDLADAEQAPRFRAAARYETDWNRKRLCTPARRLGPRLGVGWRDPEEPEQGVQLTSVRADSPAAAARLRVGDRILQCGDRKIHSGEDFSWAVFHTSGPTQLVIRRPGEAEPQTISAELPPQPLRVGVTWQVDPASPGAVVLTQVAPGSPGALAGLRTGDRVYQIDGEDFADESEFADRMKEPAKDVELLIERHGRLESVIVRFEAPLRQAA